MSTTPDPLTEARALGNQLHDEIISEGGYVSLDRGDEWIVDTTRLAKAWPAIETALTDFARLRDGIKSLADALHAKGWAAHDENDPGSASAYGHAAAALRALLDVEAKG